MQQVIIGFDTMELMKEIELSSPSEIDFGIEEIEDDDNNDDDVDDDDEDNEDDEDDDYDEVFFFFFLLSDLTWS